MNKLLILLLLTGCVTERSIEQEQIDKLTDMVRADRKLTLHTLEIYCQHVLGFKDICDEQHNASRMCDRVHYDFETCNEMYKNENWW